MSFRHLLLGASAILNIALIWALIWGEQGLAAYRALRQELDMLSARVMALSEKNVQLSREIKLLESDDEYIEQMIRNRLNFIKENEIWYISPGKSGSAEGANETEN